jgi:hypothetical protein
VSSLYFPDVFTGILNAIIGIAAVLGGASGRFQLPVSHGSEILMLFGGLVLALGAYQIIQAARGK